ncbi:MAG: hypothetical protein ACK5M3_02570 [Dysgonomonas sp.]
MYNNKILYKSSILKSIFLRNGKETQSTKLVDRKDIEVSFNINNFHLDEQYILLSKLFSEGNLLITNQYIYIITNNDLISIKNDNIDNILPFIPYTFNEIPETFYNVVIYTTQKEEFKLKMIKDDSFNGILQVFNYIIKIRKQHE